MCLKMGGGFPEAVIPLSKLVNAGYSCLWIFSRCKACRVKDRQDPRRHPPSFPSRCTTNVTKAEKRLYGRSSWECHILWWMEVECKVSIEWSYSIKNPGMYSIPKGWAAAARLRAACFIAGIFDTMVDYMNKGRNTIDHWRTDFLHSVLQKHQNRKEF